MIPSRAGTHCIAALAWLGSALSSCAHGGNKPVVTVVSLVDIDSSSCGSRAAELLATRDGVAAVKWNHRNAELTVEHNGQGITPQQILGAVEGTGSKASLGAGKGRYLDPTRFPAEFDVRWVVRNGEKAELEPEIVDGKFTVFDFYADWCGPCRILDASLLETLKSRSDIAVRKLNIVDWDSPIAAQHLASAGSLPYVIVFGPDGQKLDDIAGLDLPRLNRALARAPRSTPSTIQPPREGALPH